MKQYCINDFLDSNYGILPFLKQRAMSKLYIQMQDCASSIVMKKGEIVGKIFMYEGVNDTECIKEISIVAPIDGYYFVEPYYVLNRTNNIDISACVLKCYEDLGEAIYDGEDHFVNCYNELLSAIKDYYDYFVNTTKIKREFAHLGKCDFAIGFPKTDKPLDFLSLFDELLKKRKYLSAKDVIRRCDTITHFVEKTYTLYAHSEYVMVFFSTKSLVIDNKLIQFKEISKLCKNGEVKNHANELLFFAQSTLQESIVQNIIEANRAGADYSNICNERYLKGLEKTYSIYDLVYVEDKKIISPGEWKFKFTNEFDIAIPDACIYGDNIKERYFLNDEIIVELCDNKGKNFQVKSKESGYYSFYIPAFMDSIFFDIPFIDYESKGEHYETSKKVYDALCPTRFKIEQDKFTKKKTIVWEGLDNIQILPDEWYEFSVGLDYIKSEPTILLGFKNVYSKQTILDKYKYVDGKSYNFYLLLEDGESYEYNKRCYRNTYIGEDGYYIWVEYSLGIQDINSFLHNAIEAVRICTPEGDIFEYEAEPFFYDNFKKFVKVYYDAIVKCDASLKYDIGESSRVAEACFVYLMHDLANDYYKIGISNNPAYRERTLQSEKPTIELVMAKEFPVRRIAEAFEAALHKTYEAKRLRGEWFRLNSSDVEDLIKALS